jgi:hypothetical protein
MAIQLSGFDCSRDIYYMYSLKFFCDVHVSVTFIQVFL